MTNKERERFTTLTALHPLKSKRLKGIRIFVLTNGLLKPAKERFYCRLQIPVST